MVLFSFQFLIVGFVTRRDRIQHPGKLAFGQPTPTQHHARQHFHESAFHMLPSLSICPGR
jgi:hypothetical protein